MTMQEQSIDLFTNPKRWGDMDDWRQSILNLHAEGPVHEIETEYFPPFKAVLTRDMIYEIERNHQIFSNSPEPVLVSHKALAARPFSLRTLVHMDAPDHQKYRQLAQNWFRGPSLQAMTGRLDALTEKAVGRMEASNGECDFAGDIALRYPLEAVLAILGLPEEDYDLMLRLTQEMFGGEDPDMRRGSASKVTFGEVVQDIMAYFRRVLADRRAKPTDDLASAIANGTVDGELMPELDALSYYLIVATAGHDTTSYAMSGGMQALAAHPDQFRMLQDDPSLLNGAIDEIFRWTTPARHFMRTALEDKEIAGHPFKKGDWVYLSYPAANFDPEQYDDPLRFDIKRDNAGRHATFGHGVHFCLGMQLAKMELQSLCGKLVERLDHVELAGPTAYSRTTAVGGVKRLPLRYSFKT